MKDFINKDKDLKDARIRKNLINEIYTTEEAYVNHLRVLVNVFLNPIRAKKILKPQDVDIIFGSGLI